MTDTVRPAPGSPRCAWLWSVAVVLTLAVPHVAASSERALEPTSSSAGLRTVADTSPAENPSADSILAEVPVLGTSRPTEPVVKCAPDRSWCISATTITRQPTDPLDGATFHTASWTSAGQAADQIRASRPDDAALLDRLASTPTARWYGEWSGDVRAAADGYVSEAAAAGRLPMLVAYNIPLRDCGSYSGGGAASADAYRSWIRSFDAGIEGRPALVVLEPDAVALAECLSAADRATRNDLLADAISVLADDPDVIVYLDGGHSSWLSADELADRLVAGGVSGARGFSLNVSNFHTTAANVDYAEAVHARIGKPAVIDTGRNGAGSDGTWCNPFGRAIGPAPTTSTGSNAVDALLWVKVPGESDGTCNGGPAAGTFWIDYAVSLVSNATVG